MEKIHGICELWVTGECTIFSGHINFRQKPTATVNTDKRPTSTDKNFVGNFNVKKVDAEVRQKLSGSGQTEDGQDSINWSENYRLVLVSLVNLDWISRVFERIVKDFVVHCLEENCLIDESSMASEKVDLFSSQEFLSH